MIKVTNITFAGECHLVRDTQAERGTVVILGRRKGDEYKLVKIVYNGPNQPYKGILIFGFGGQIIGVKGGVSPKTLGLRGKP